MMALPYNFTPKSGYCMTTTSSALTPRASMLSSEVKVKPVMASTSPRTNMVSRNGGSIAVQATVPMPLAFWKMGKARRPASNTGAPNFLPAKSAGTLMPDFFSAMTDAGVLL